MQKNSAISVLSVEEIINVNKGKENAEKLSYLRFLS